jgi:GTP:adenosylcobinamide-phosphate guanylyltransferase
MTRHDIAALNALQLRLHHTIAIAQIIAKSLTATDIENDVSFALQGIADSLITISADLDVVTPGHPTT